jgi:hypothetical protein
MIGRREFLGKSSGFVAYSIVGRSRVMSTAQALKPATGALTVHPRNPRYFADGSGHAIFLTGSHTWANMQDMGFPLASRFDWEGYLAMMHRHNHNFMRLWGWQQSAWGPWTPEKILIQPALYMRTGPGGALDGGLKFDLKTFNPTYFGRMRVRVLECRNRGIYCAVQLFQGWSSNKRGACGDQTWSGHPYNAQNNINGINGDQNRDGVVDIDQPAIRELHAAYLKKVVDTVHDLDNVLYEVINEGGGREWDWWVVDTIHKLETEKAKRHPVGITGSGSETMEEMLASPAEWISPFGVLFRDPPAWDGRKVSVNDTDHLWGHGGTVTWAWKSFIRGHNTLLMDPWEPVAGRSCQEMNWMAQPGAPHRDLNHRDAPTWEPVRRALGYTRRYAVRMDLASVAPIDELASTHYCLANPEREFLVYLPEGDSVTVDLSRAPGKLTCEWMHPTEGTILRGGQVSGGAETTFVVPFVGPAVLYVWKN